MFLLYLEGFWLLNVFQREGCVFTPPKVVVVFRFLSKLNAFSARLHSNVLILYTVSPHHLFPNKKQLQWDPHSIKWSTTECPWPAHTLETHPEFSHSTGAHSSVWTHSNNPSSLPAGQKALKPGHHSYMELCRAVKEGGDFTIHKKGKKKGTHIHPHLIYSEKRL